MDLVHVTNEWIASYARDDWALALLREVELESDHALTCHRWIHDTLAKRAIFSIMYPDLVEPGGRSVLDVGGGLTAFARMLHERNDYVLLDLLAHDSAEDTATFRAHAPDLEIACEDWMAYSPERDFDVIIANDLFPNADQRLSLFLEKYLPRCRELRLSLTFYNSPRYYLVRRIDAEEIFSYMCWNGQQTLQAIEPYLPNVNEQARAIFACNEDSPYANGRQVVLVTLQGQA